MSLVVGGHTHTFLYSGSDAPGPEKPKGPYPVVVQQQNGRKVLVVQAALNAMYIGNLTMWFDEDGDVVEWEGNPVYLDKKVKQGEFVRMYFVCCRRRQQPLLCILYL